jgi:hypothetical protein
MNIIPEPTTTLDPGVDYPAGITDVGEYLRDCVRIEPLVIEEEYVRLPADLAYWNARFSESVQAFLTAKMNAEEHEARQRILHREILLAAGGKATESQVDAAVTCDPSIREVRIKYIAAEARKHHIGGIVDAIRTKRDMLISLGAHMRAELQGDPVLKTDRANRRG